MNVYFHTFGCKANQYDTELVRQAFADHGATAVDDPERADLAVVNSCAVTAAGEAKMRSLLRRPASLLSGGPSVTLARGAFRSELGGSRSSLT